MFEVDAHDCEQRASNGALPSSRLPEYRPDEIPYPQES